MTERRRYKNPPIEEALCEFRFQHDPGWDLTIPGKLQVELGEEYSGRPQEQKAIQVGLDFQDGRPSNLQYGEGLARVQLVTKDGKRMVGVGPNLLSIHMLHPDQSPPYPESSGWSEFKPRILSALKAYWKVVNPDGVRWVSIRYINKIIVPGNSVRVEEYLRSASPEVLGLPEDYSSYVSRVEYQYADGVRLVVSQGSAAAAPTRAEFLLDLDVIWESTEPLLQAEALDRADDLRDRERAAFEAVITDKARELFDANRVS